MYSVCGDVVRMWHIKLPYMYLHNFFLIWKTKSTHKGCKLTIGPAGCAVCPWLLKIKFGLHTMELKGWEETLYVYRCVCASYTMQLVYLTWSVPGLRLMK